MKTVHVVGAGIAGLTAAVKLLQAGCKPILHEAASHAGGRCRSFFCKKLERGIDNGTHLILGANPALFDLMKTTGGSLQESSPAAFPFFDRQACKGWTIRPSKGAIPWWVLNPSARLPDSSALDYLGGLRLLKASPETTVAQAVGGNDLLERLWGPLCEAILNCRPQEGQARLLGEVLRLTLLKGEAACRPFEAPQGLSAALIDPALAWLSANGADIRLAHRLTAIEPGTLIFENGERIAISRHAPAILALSSFAARALLPDLPDLQSRPIVCVHFRLPERLDGLPGNRRHLGIVRGLGQWWSLRDDVLSVTVSAATGLAENESDQIADRLWAECALMLGLPPQTPIHRVMKEKRATILHAPAIEELRPSHDHLADNGLILAGDWTATGLPSTLEGAARSGERAANAILAR